MRREKIRIVLGWIGALGGAFLIVVFLAPNMLESYWYFHITGLDGIMTFFLLSISGLPLIISLLNKKISLLSKIGSCLGLSPFVLLALFIATPILPKNHITIAIRWTFLFLAFSCMILSAFFGSFGLKTFRDYVIKLIDLAQKEDEKKEKKGPAFGIPIERK